MLFANAAKQSARSTPVHGGGDRRWALVRSRVLGRVRVPPVPALLLVCQPVGPVLVGEEEGLPKGPIKRGGLEGLRFNFSFIYF